MPIVSTRKPKNEVNYRLHEQCSSCIHFYGSQCELVDGNVSADAVCDLWTLKEASKSQDGEFFVEQYKSEQGDDS